MTGKFIIEFRYLGTDYPFFDLFDQGKWRKWKGYKTLRAANNAIEALHKNKLSIGKRLFEYRLTAGSVVTTTYSDGTQKKETA